MKTRDFVLTAILAAALPALAVPNCPAPQVPLDVNCTLTVTAGWGVAGLGTASVLTAYLPPTASAPVIVNLKALNSNLGSTYTGFLGVMVSTPGQPGAYVLTADNSVPAILAPGKTVQLIMTQVCWDPPCHAAAPAGAVPNMVSVQEILSSTTPADINLVSVQLTAQFLTGSQVEFQEAEMFQLPGPNVSYIPSVNIGSSPGTRYVYNGTAVTQPYAVLSITNTSGSPITGTVTLVDRNNAFITNTAIPSIPVNGAVGYLVVGRNADDPLALYPYSIVLPPGSDGAFHGTLIVSMTGSNITLAQEFNGNSMLNLLVQH